MDFNKGPKLTSGEKEKDGPKSVFGQRPKGKATDLADSGY